MSGQTIDVLRNPTHCTVQSATTLGAWQHLTIGPQVRAKECFGSGRTSNGNNQDSADSTWAPVGSATISHGARPYFGKLSQGTRGVGAMVV